MNPRLSNDTYLEPLETNVTNVNAGRGWRRHAGHWLESKPVHTALVVLIVVDFGIVMAEILISLRETDQHANHHEEPYALEVLSLISLIIVCIFAVEILMKLFVFGLKYFLHFWIHLFDAVVVFVTLILILAAHGTDIEDVAGMLIVFRFWRIIRVIDAVALTTTEHELHRIELLESEMDHLKQRNTNLVQTLQEHGIALPPSPLKEQINNV